MRRGDARIDSLGARGDWGKIGTLRIKAHNFDIINVKKKLQLGYISINSLLNNSIYRFFLIEQIQKNF